MFRVPEKNTNYTSDDKKVFQELILLSKIFFWGGRNYLLKELKEIFLAEGISDVRQWMYERDWQMQRTRKDIQHARGKKVENAIGNEKYGTLL